MKTAFQRIHRILCAPRFICPESEPTIFRSACNGQWNWIGPFTQERAIPIGGSAQKTIAPEDLEKAKEWANSSSDRSV
jgi:hypothetical protein